MPRAVRGDVTRLRQILVNLLGNAVKFTERGGITLSVECTERSDGRVNIVFAVRDTGIGMTPEAMSRIFMPFTQADTSTTRRFGGSGLGLSIVRQLVELMGGEVSVSSELGEGSEFRVALPMAVVADVDDGQEGSALALEILVLEPEDQGRHVVRDLARMMGWRPELVATNFLWTAGLAG